jgi:hypothetical protein
VRLELARTKALTLPSSTAGLSENNFELEVFLSISPHALMVCLPPFSRVWQKRLTFNCQGRKLTGDRAKYPGIFGPLVRVCFEFRSSGYLFRRASHGAPTPSDPEPQRNSPGHTTVLTTASLPFCRGAHVDYRGLRPHFRRPERLWLFDESQGIARDLTYQLHPATYVELRK